MTLTEQTTRHFDHLLAASRGQKCCFEAIDFLEKRMTAMTEILHELRLGESYHLVGEHTVARINELFGPVQDAPKDLP